MHDVTQILNQIESGDPLAADKLLPLVYDELRRLAALKLAQENPGQTLQATALVHDAYIRLVDVDKAQNWDSRGHFFSAAAESMRRILVGNARRKQSLKAGGNRERIKLDQSELPAKSPNPDVLALSEALDKLEGLDPRKAALVKLRYYAGLTNAQAAAALKISTSSADNDWAYAKNWLRVEIAENTP